MGRKRKKRQQRNDDDLKMDPDLASDICGDLPDGAYWAMMEELTGMEPCDLVHDLDDQND